MLSRSCPFFASSCVHCCCCPHTGIVGGTLVLSEECEMARGMPLLHADANGLSAIDHHRMPSREGAIRRAKPQDRGRDLLRLAQAPDRLLSNHAIVPIGCTRGDTIDHGRVDDNRADGVYADVGFAVTEAPTVAETYDTKL